MTCTRCGESFREGAGAWGGGRTVLDEADGLVLWGGFKTTAPAGPLPWDENAPWWVTIKARLTDKRRTG